MYSARDRYDLGPMASDKKKKKIRIKKKCCESKRLCTGCPLRPENRSTR